jgi:hypothetical protein
MGGLRREKQFLGVLIFCCLLKVLKNYQLQIVNLMKFLSAACMYTVAFAMRLDCSVANLNGYTFMVSILN